MKMNTIEPAGSGREPSCLTQNPREFPLEPSKCLQLEQGLEVRDQHRDPACCVVDVEPVEAPPMQSGSFPQDSMEGLLRIWQGLHPGPARQVQRDPSLGIPCGSTDCGLGKQKPSFLHPHRDHANRGRPRDVPHCTMNLVEPTHQGSLLCIAVFLNPSMVNRVNMAPPKRGSKKVRPSFTFRFRVSNGLLAWSMRPDNDFRSSSFNGGRGSIADRARIGGVGALLSRGIPGWVQIMNSKSGGSKHRGEHSLARITRTLPVDASI